ncbi:MAG TPA: hypothetical protein VFM58_02670 [Solirubrobacteraceae bacterium]|nr:hypothetical protein [Solirubrobacteraceae bacterium]
MTEWLTGTWALGVAVVGFLAATVAIGTVGTRLAGTVDRLADRTGIGEALAGAVLLAGANSIAGLIVSVIAAAEGDASLAVSNSVGGIAAQTAMIVGADIAYRGANIEHAAASLTNVFNSLLMVALLAIVVMGASWSDVSFMGISPATPLLVAAYLYGLHLGRRTEQERMWRPHETSETIVDEPDTDAAADVSTRRLWLTFAGLAAAMTVAGWAIGRSGLSIVAATGISSTVVGTFFTSVSTSLPELVTAIAAARAGAPTLAVGGIVGGNTFDMLFVAVADGVYRGGSIYEHLATSDIFVLGWAMLLVAIAGAGLVRRHREGIGFEGVLILALYASGLVALTAM